MSQPNKAEGATRPATPPSEATSETTRVTPGGGARSPSLLLACIADDKQRAMYIAAPDMFAVFQMIHDLEICNDQRDHHAVWDAKYGRKPDQTRWDVINRAATAAFIKAGGVE